MAAEKPLLAEYMTPALLKMPPAERYAAIIRQRAAVVAEARRRQAALTRWAALQIRRLAAEGLGPEEIAAAVKAAGGSVGASTVRRILAQSEAARRG